MMPSTASATGKAFFRTRECRLFAPVYAFIALILLRTKILLTLAWTDGTLIDNHRSLLAFTFTNNEQSRLLQFYIPEFFRILFGVSIPDAYLIQRW